MWMMYIHLRNLIVFSLVKTIYILLRNLIILTWLEFLHSDGDFSSNVR